MDRTKVFSRITALIVLISLSASVNGQGKIIEAEPSHFVFKTFKKGIIKKKSGTKISSQLNYNTITQEMVFEKNSKRMSLIGLEDIEAVFIEDRKFVPHKTMFHEEIEVGHISLYIQHKCDLESKGQDIGYGTSHTTKTVSITDIMASSSIYELELPEEFEVAESSIYWVKKGDVKKIVTNEKKLLKLLPEKKLEIQTYIKENKLKAKKIDDLAQIVRYCNELYK